MLMTGMPITIVFKDDMAFLTNEIALNFDQVKVSDYPVKLKRPACWKLFVISYLRDEKRLHVGVSNYSHNELTFSSEQNRLADVLIEVEKVSFSNISTPGLLSTFSILPEPLNIKFEPINSKNVENQPEIVYTKETYHESFSVAFKNVRFLDRKVSFSKRIQHVNRDVQFEIKNEAIIQEFNSIKNYFGNALGSKNIEVTASVETFRGEVVSSKAISKQIDQIDGELIKQVQYEIVKKARKVEHETKKQLLTLSEYFKAYTDDNNGTSSLFKSDNEMLEVLLKTASEKHHTHLRFLSSKHAHLVEGLRYIQRPFSFMFILEGFDNYHFVWETLDTEEATYVWTSEKSIPINEFLKFIDKTIKSIITDGKNQYLQLKETNFQRVFHDYSDPQNGFKVWKLELEAVILK